MKISYDPKVDAMYIRFKSGKYDHTKKVTDEILVDVTKSGDVLGLGISKRKKSNFLQNLHIKALSCYTII